MKKVALIVAGGKGKRMNSEIPKQFLLLNNLPVLMHTIKQFSHFSKIILVLPESEFNYWKKLCEELGFEKNIIVVAGGESRFQSVKNGLEKIDLEVIVAIHDGARPIISKPLINSLISAAKRGVGIVPIIPIKNSIRKVLGEESKSIDRSNIYQVQTPQCFISDDIKDAYKQSFSEKFSDDASVLENNGGKIITITGEEKNIKITTPEDLNIAKYFMQ